MDAIPVVGHGPLEGSDRWANAPGRKQFVAYACAWQWGYASDRESSLDDMRKRPSLRFAHRQVRPVKQRRRMKRHAFTGACVAVSQQSRRRQCRVQADACCGLARQAPHLSTPTAPAAHGAQTARQRHQHFRFPCALRGRSLQGPPVCQWGRRNRLRSSVNAQLQDEKLRQQD